MARINSALYDNDPDLIDSLEVDDHPEKYYKERFRCPECLVKIQYNSGIHKLDPHFKNWPNISHKEDCEIEKLQSLQSQNDNHNIQRLTSTILPRAERLQKFSTPQEKQKIIRRYLGRRSQIFLNALISIQDFDHKAIFIRTEDRQSIPIADLIMRQDQIVQKLNVDNKPFICILKGYLTTKIEIANNIKIPLTYGGKYQNKHKFDIFIPSSFKEKNIDKINQIEKSLVYCYGLAEKNEYGYKMDLYSITHQISKIQ